MNQRRTPEESRPITSRSWSCQRRAGSDSTSLISGSSQAGSAKPVFSGVQSLHGRNPAASASRALSKLRDRAISRSALPQTSVQKMPVGNEVQ
jgi:hypothetical protein